MELWTLIWLCLVSAPRMLFVDKNLQEAKTFDNVWCPKISDILVLCFFLLNLLSMEGLGAPYSR